ncbi:MAG: hypothetical protein H0W97_05390 [Actinobacteria bacterium]|nr:hypothetical protein [Actinomycetota bacterium]
MANVMPISDRRARLALILAVLGVPSLGITVPSAIWLGFRAVRLAICTASTLRIHPERWGALLVARAGMIGAMVGGTALFVQLIAVID